MVKPIVLCILDGVGNNEDKRFNGVLNANTPFLNELFLKYPHTNLKASGVAVGLPIGTIGNSEVGHKTMGLGRIVPQFLERFDMENWNENVALAQFIEKLKSSGGMAHIVGLMSDGRVHSDIEKTLFIVKRILKSGIKACIHFVSDGRDVMPKSSIKYANQIKEELGVEKDNVCFATLQGRYWAMDRNNNDDRTERAADLIINGVAEFTAGDIITAIYDAYNRGETDEFIKPTVINSCPIQKNDGILFANYRGDRARQILRALIKASDNILSFSQYGEELNDLCPALLTDIKMDNSLGRVLADNGKTQLRIAETEKYNHVTYFFDGEKNEDFIGADKILIPSPDVATFDMAPEMSANEITAALLPVLPKYDVVILNYANGDMVGHTANMDAAVQAMESLDRQLSKIVPAVLDLGGALLITADHGNVEQLWDFENDSPWTAHTANTVPLIVVSDKYNIIASGGLSDIAPTILNMLGIDKPDEMTGKNLVA